MVPTEPVGFANTAVPTKTPRPLILRLAIAIYIGFRDLINTIRNRWNSLCDEDKIGFSMFTSGIYLVIGAICAALSLGTAAAPTLSDYLITWTIGVLPITLGIAYLCIRAAMACIMYFYSRIPEV